ncbi:extracellular solute-binding protein [Parasphaerochaeta coccoides]|uniref:Extracellular solute-binding protein family 1 n=1 Tax=Parasphaerochaeta coccoides (strain ATCC BAA-1237 / DSM 17374 / SPN1) TaxID=760011 RepID=F4GHW1_PARC1|nr:extracellular solute-binding protein family 1 [Parasphaerochaeta coccoides DSM 17374]
MSMHHDTRRSTYSVKVACAVLLAAAFLAGLTACSRNSSPKSNGEALYLYNWTYYTPDSILLAFTEETGIQVIVDNFSSNEEMFAKLRAGGGRVGYDIVFPSADYTSIMIKLDMLEKLDHEKLPNVKHATKLVHEKATYDPDFLYSVPYFMGAAGVAVNTTLVPSGYERNWDIFADKRFARRMTMLDDMREVMGDALIHLGYSNNTTDLLQLAEAQSYIIENWKPNLVKFDAESFGKSFGSGEFWAVHSYPENVYEEFPESRWHEIDFFLPPEGGSMYIDNMVILKDAPHKDAAHAFIDFIYRPEIYAQFLDEFHLPPTVHSSAVEYMETTPLYSADDLANYSIIEDLGESLDLYNDLWHDIRYMD